MKFHELESYFGSQTTWHENLSHSCRAILMEGKIVDEKDCRLLISSLSSAFTIRKFSRIAQAYPSIYIFPMIVEYYPAPQNRLWAKFF